MFTLLIELAGNEIILAVRNVMLLEKWIPTLGPWCAHLTVATKLAKKFVGSKK